MNAYYQAERFIEIIQKAGGEGLFTNEDGILTNIVHTGRTIEAFYLKIEFPDDTVLITTSLFHAVEEYNCGCVKTLLDSINSLGHSGKFFISDDNIISFSTICEFNDLIEADNPFEIVFCGCETFEMYTNAILKYDKTP